MLCDEFASLERSANKKSLKLFRCFSKSNNADKNHHQRLCALIGMACQAFVADSSEPAEHGRQMEI